MPPSWRQYIVPRVFGMISDKNKIAKVMNAENSPNQALPKTIVACAPAPIEPKVCATVFNVKMAAND